MSLAGGWHRIEIGGEPWELSQGGSGEPFVARRPGADGEAHLEWNGRPSSRAQGPDPRSDGPPAPAWPSPRRWLPVALLCCRADAAMGPGFASAILDADPGDDAPALIACDWIEGLGIDRDIDLGRHSASGKALVAAYRCRPHPPRNAGWEYVATRMHPRPGPAKWAAALRFRPAEWARSLIRDMCAHCGGAKHGRDLIIEAGIPIPCSNVSRRRARDMEEYAALPICDRCRVPCPIRPAMIRVPVVDGPLPEE